MILREKSAPMQDRNSGAAFETACYYCYFLLLHCVEKLVNNLSISIVQGGRQLIRCVHTRDRSSPKTISRRCITSVSNLRGRYHLDKLDLRVLHISISTFEPLNRALTMLHQSQTLSPSSSGDVLALNSAKIVRNTLPRYHQKRTLNTDTALTIASPLEARYSMGILLVSFIDIANFYSVPR